MKVNRFGLGCSICYVGLGIVIAVNSFMIDSPLGGLFGMLVILVGGFHSAYAFENEEVKSE